VGVVGIYGLVGGLVTIQKSMRMLAAGTTRAVLLLAILKFTIGAALRNGLVQMSKV
jgi:hypothetical protein